MINGWHALAPGQYIKFNVQVETFEKQPCC
jgi:hypothetical protein